MYFLNLGANGLKPRISLIAYYVETSLLVVSEYDTDPLPERLHCKPDERFKFFFV